MQTRILRKNLIIFIFTIISLSLTITLGIFLAQRQTLAPEDSNALVEGREESGYQYVGYIISDQQKVCAATLIDPQIIITAGHCLANPSGDTFLFGTGEFDPDSEDLVNITAALFPQEFMLDTAKGPDLSIAVLERPIQADTSITATLTIPYENCEASIVAYGAGIESGKAVEDMFIKKSGEGCVRAITRNFLLRFNKEVGMCFGDSGGPIFKENGSNQIIGILSGGLINPQLEKLECDPGNTGYVVNVNAYKDFIDNAIIDLKNEQISLDTGSKYRILNLDSVDNFSTKFQANLAQAQLIQTEEKSSSEIFSVEDPNLPLKILVIFFGILTGLGVIIIIIRVIFKNKQVEETNVFQN